MVVNSKFWKDKKVFITGHTGFKGGWLCAWLEHLGAKVSGYALKPQNNPNIFNILKIKNLCDSTIGNIQNKKKLTDLLKKQKPDIIFHLAAQPLVRQSYKDPLETYQTNVIGTANLLWATMQVNTTKAFVCITTDKCYENMEWHKGYIETDKLGGYDPYSSSKACTEIVTASFRQSFFANSNCNIATARAGNVIGGGDWADERLVPDCIRTWQNKKTVQIRYPNSTRPWQHVLEPLSGYLMLGQKLYSKSGKSFASPWNFGSNNKSVITVEKLIEILSKNWGSGSNWKTSSKKQPHEAGLLKLNCKKAKKQLNWQPCWPIEKAAAKTIDWYKQYYEKSGDLMAATIDQIEEYTRDMKKIK